MKTQLTHKFEDIISIENLLEAWEEFGHDKRKKQDVRSYLGLLGHGNMKKLKRLIC